MPYAFAISSIFNKPSRILEQFVKNGSVVTGDSFVDGDLDENRIDFCLEGAHTETQLKTTQTFGNLLTKGTITFGEITKIHDQVLSVFQSDNRLLSCPEDKVFTLQYSDFNGQTSVPLRNVKAKGTARPICFISVKATKDTSKAPTFG